MRILFGTAGWSYADWRGRVYPRRPGRDFDELAYLTGFFDLVEVNSTFYRLPPPDLAHRWLERTAGRPEFRFLLKAPQAWTHTRDAPDSASISNFRGLAEILAGAGRLGALLLQFPWSFRNEPASRERVAEIASLLAGLPVAVEVRHGGFAKPTWAEYLDSLGCAPVNVDQPLIGDSLPLGSASGKPFAYFRFHGRNRDNWFDEDADRDQRYDYLYAKGEIDELAERIAAAAAIAPLVFVILNNHFRGQAAANALQLKYRFMGGPLPHPPELLRHYPALRPNAALPPGGQAELF
jgi:uncharacterized protein YecE (DUF72 family)